MSSYFERISEIVACDRGARGVSRLIRDCYWQRASDMLCISKRIAIITGFMVPDANSPETDGPPGTVILGRALLRSGRECNVFTDPHCFGAVSRCSESVHGPSVISIEGSCAISEWHPDLVIFIERLGRASDGRYYNMRCRDISEYTYPLDEILFCGEKSDFATLAIGDGGNEAGMGSLSSEIREILPDFAGCVSVAEADLVLPVDVSNWGAYALATLLSIAEGRWLGHSFDEERSMLRALLGSGAVDGLTKKADLSVDGFPLDEEKKILIALRQIYSDSMLSVK